MVSCQQLLVSFILARQYKQTWDQSRPLIPCNACLELFNFILGNIIRRTWAAYMDGGLVLFYCCLQWFAEWCQYSPFTCSRLSRQSGLSGWRTLLLSEHVRLTQPVRPTQSSQIPTAPACERLHFHCVKSHYPNEKPNESIVLWNGHRRVSCQNQLCSLR